MVDGKVKTPKKRKDSKVEEPEAHDVKKKRKKESKETSVEVSEQKSETLFPEVKEKKKKRKKAEVKNETKDETVEETTAQEEETGAKKQKPSHEKRKKKKSKEEKEKKDAEQTTESATKVDRAVQYLRLWSEHRKQWTFNKTLQTCLLQNAFNEQKVKLSVKFAIHKHSATINYVQFKISDENFEILLSYMKNGKGGSISATLKKAEDLMSKLEGETLFRKK